MLPPPRSRSTTPEQIRELDESFFCSDPHSYFMARVESLIAYGDGARANHGSGLGAEFARRIGWDRSSENLLPTSPEARELQVAVDALSLRQHVAEGVARIWLALLKTRAATPGSLSTWQALADTPTSNLQVFNAIQACDGWDDMSVHLSLLLPQPMHSRFETDANVRHAVDVLHKWLEHTVELLTRSDIHVAAANNKYKHGLAVRPRADERISFLKAEAVPREGDALPAEASIAEIPIFDVPFVEYLAKRPRDDTGEHGLELTRLRLDTPALLIESTMLATVYGALFHVAAAKHADWSGTEGRIAPYPSLPMGPTPKQLLGTAVVGMRSPVTFRPDGTPPTRGHAIGFANGQWVGLDIDYNGRRAMRVTDDTPTG